MSRLHVARWVGLGVAATVTIAGLSTGLLTARAEEPLPTPSTAAQAQQQVNQLETERADIQRRYDALMQRATEAASKVDGKTKELEEQQKRVGDMKTQLAQLALAQYQNRSADSTEQLLVAGDPSQFLHRVSTVQKVQSDNSRMLQHFQAEQAALAQTRRDLEASAAQAKKDAAEMEGLEKQAKEKVERGKAIVAKLSAEERAKMQREQDARDAALRDEMAKRGSHAAVLGTDTDRGSKTTDPVSRDVSRPVLTSVGNNYAFGNCTWYSYERRKALGRPINGSWGNANQWAASARRDGFRVDRTPEPGAVMVSFAGWAGHVGVVESVSPDGSISISEMNWAGFNRVSSRTLSPGEVSALNFIH